MKVLIFVNRDKDPDGTILQKLQTALKSNGVLFDACINGESYSENHCHYDAIFVVGGDGTLLRRTAYANGKQIPLIGINAGKLGFLNEFETSEIEEAVSLFANNELVRDERVTMVAQFKDKTYFALNDVVVQRTYLDSHGALVNVNVFVDSNHVNTFRGDGIIVATPTGSTAYSLSAGGAILAPEMRAFIITPISAHSFNQRPIIYSAKSTCKINVVGNTSAGLIIDGNFVDVVNDGDVITLKKAENPTVFLRRKDYNFYSRLTQKLKHRIDGIV